MNDALETSKFDELLRAVGRVSARQAPQRPGPALNALREYLREEFEPNGVDLFESAPFTKLLDDYGYAAAAKNPFFQRKNRDEIVRFVREHFNQRRKA